MNKDVYYDSYMVNFKEGDKALFRDKLSVVTSLNDNEYIIKQGDTLGSIAYRFYSDSKLWYIIADINDILNPFSLEVGKSLIIPDINRINHVK